MFKPFNSFNTISNLHILLVCFWFPSLPDKKFHEIEKECVVYYSEYYFKKETCYLDGFSSVFAANENFIIASTKNNMLTAHRIPARPRRRDISSDAIG